MSLLCAAEVVNISCCYVIRIVLCGQHLCKMDSNGLCGSVGGLGSKMEIGSLELDEKKDWRASQEKSEWIWRIRR